MAAAISTGDCSGVVNTKRTTKVNGEKMAKLLRAQGSDPEFFQLTADGKDI